jgi:hypothetical protein
MPNDPIPPRYQFVVGNADANQATLLNQAAANGYRATMMALNPTAQPNSLQVVVLMELET